MPNDLLRDVDDGRVVFFCGSGVSRARAGLPNFLGLLAQVLDTLGVGATDPVRNAAADATDEDVPPELRSTASADAMFGYLERSYDVADIEEAVAQALAAPDADLSAHRDLLDLSRMRATTAPHLGAPRIVTTNFDPLFERVDPVATVWVGPRLPDDRRNDPFEGIVKLHGSVNERGDGAVPPGFVLSSAGFGDAYLASGWATRFVRDVVRGHPIVFVGYAADDPPVRYLLEALARQPVGSRMFAFQLEGPGARDKWQSKGVVPLLFGAYPDLWATIGAWAERRRDPEGWRCGVLDLAAREPETLTPCERGQVAELVSSVGGARAWAGAAPSAAWLRVLDARERYATPDWGEDHYRRTAPAHDPHDALRLDDDPPPPAMQGTNTQEERLPPVAAWDAFAAGDETRPADAFTGEMPRPDLGPRRWALARWIGARAHEPATLWWALRRGTLHPALRVAIEDGHAAAPRPSEAPIAWQRLFELQAARHDPDHTGDYAFRRAVDHLGWGPEALRLFEHHSRPRPTRRWYSHLPRPPEPGTSLRGLVERQVDVRGRFFMTTVPDAYLAPVIHILRMNLEWAVANAGEDRLTRHWDLPSFHPVEDETTLRDANDLDSAILAFTRKLARLHALDPGALRREVGSWPADGAPFAKLRVWLIDQDFVGGAWAAELLAAIPDDAFWNSYQQRDLMLALARRWGDLPETATGAVARRILAGNPSEYLDDSYRARTALERLQWLLGEGIDLAPDVRAAMDRLAEATPDWRPEHAAHAVDSFAVHGGTVATDDSHDVLDGVAIPDIVRVAREHTGHTDRVTVHTNPFIGLVRSDPERALDALRRSDAPAEDRMAAWEDMLHHEVGEDWSEPFRREVFSALHDIAHELSRSVLLPATRRLRDAVREGAAWVFERGELLDRLIERNAALLPGSGVEMTSSRADRDLTMRSINSVTGVLVQALRDDPALPNPADGSGVPSLWAERMERLLALPGPQDVYALTELGTHLAYLNALDPAWTLAHLLPALDDPRTMVALMARVRAFPPAHYDRLKPIVLEEASKDQARRLLPDETIAGELLRGWVGALEGTPHVSDAELRDALTGTDEPVRLAWLRTLEDWLTHPSPIRDALRERMPHLFDRVWPRRTSVRSEATTVAMLDVIAASGPYLPAAASAACRHLESIRSQNVWLGNWDEADGVRCHPRGMRELLLDLLPPDRTLWPWDMTDTLERLEALERGDEGSG